MPSQNEIVYFENFMIHSRLLNVRILYVDMGKRMLDVVLNLHEISGLKIVKTTGLREKKK